MDSILGNGSKWFGFTNDKQHKIKISRNIASVQCQGTNIHYLHRVLFSNERPFLSLSVDLVAPDGLAKVVRMDPEGKGVERENPNANLTFHVPKFCKVIIVSKVWYL